MPLDFYEAWISRRDYPQEYGLSWVECYLFKSEWHDGYVEIKSDFYGALDNLGNYVREEVDCDTEGYWDETGYNHLLSNTVSEYTGDKHSVTYTENDETITNCRTIIFSPESINAGGLIYESYFLDATVEENRESIWRRIPGKTYIYCIESSSRLRNFQHISRYTIEVGKMNLSDMKLQFEKEGELFSSETLITHDSLVYNGEPQDLFKSYVNGNNLNSLLPQLNLLGYRIFTDENNFNRYLTVEGVTALTDVYKDPDGDNDYVEFSIKPREDALGQFVEGEVTFKWNLKPKELDLSQVVFDYNGDTTASDVFYSGKGLESMITYNTSSVGEIENIETKPKYKLVVNSENDEAITNTIKPGNYKVHLVLADDEYNYIDTSTTKNSKDYTIILLNLNDATVELLKDSFEYNGQEHQALIKKTSWENGYSFERTAENAIEALFNVSNNTATNAHQYNLTIAPNTEDTYITGSKQVSYEITKFKVSPTWTEEEFIYNGSVQNITLPTANAPEGVTPPLLQCSIEGGKEFKNVDNYKFIASLKKKEENFEMDLENDNTKTYSISHKKVIVSWDADTLSFIYDGENHLPSLTHEGNQVEVITGEVITLNVDWYDESNKNANVGTYKAKVEFASITGGVLTNYVLDTETTTKDFSIVSYQIDEIIWSQNSFVYNGQIQDYSVITAKASLPEGYEEYSLVVTKESVDDFNAAGEYIFKVSLQSDNNNFVLIIKLN